VAGDEEDEEMQVNSVKSNGIRPWLLTKPLISYIDTLTPDRLIKLINAFRKERGMPLLAITDAPELWDTAVVHVRLEMLGRGSPGDNAIIYSLDSYERESWIKAHEVERELDIAGFSGISSFEPIISEIQKVSSMSYMEHEI